jgi:hypothetical protein
MTEATVITQGIVLVNADQEQTIIDLLDRLAGLNAELEQVGKERDAELDSMIPTDLKKKISAKRGAYTAKTNRLDKDIDAVTNTIRAMTLKHGATVKGEGYQAVVSKGRVSWDNSKIEGYLIAQDQDLDNYRTVGNPSVSIRKVKT